MDRESISPQLLADVKNYLNITWDDDAADRKVRGLIAEGAAYLDSKRGAPADYAADGLPRSLLMDYVRYARDGARDVFENNFQSLLLGMQTQWAVKQYVESTLPAGE